MGGGGTKPGGDRSFETNKQYGWMAPDSWGDLDAYRNFDFNNALGDQLLAPELERQFATTARDLKTSYASPYGSEMGAEERQQGYRDSLERLNESRAGATEQASFDRSRLLAQLEAQRKAQIAGMTAPQLVNTKESGYGQKQGGGGFWGSLAQGGLAAATAFL